MKEVGRILSGQVSFGRVCRRCCSGGRRADPEWDDKPERAGTLVQNEEARLATPENQHFAPPTAPGFSHSLFERFPMRLPPISSVLHHP
jgi:hypothetical protein